MKSVNIVGGLLGLWKADDDGDDDDVMMIVFSQRRKYNN